MAVAQALLCTDGNPTGCGTCSACTRAVRLCEGPPAVPIHPDVIFVERALYLPETIGRRTPEAQGISVDQIRTVVLGHTSYRPHEGRARVFIVRRAEELTVAAANAMLKTLEEPAQGTHFILLVTHSSKLISTIQSRTLRIRFAPLPDDVITSILRARGIDAVRAAEVAMLAAGSASQAIALVDEESSKDRDAFVQAALDGIASPDFAPSMAIAEARSRDKSAVKEQLESLAARFAMLARASVGSHGDRAISCSLRYQIVLDAMRELERNASPTLLIETMMMRLRAEEP